VRKQQG